MSDNQQFMSISIRFGVQKMKIVFILITIMLPGIAISEGNLSTPEGTIMTFVEAFRTGNHNLLVKTLASDAKLYEFNSSNIIICPTPEIKSSTVKNVLEIHEEEVELLLLIETSVTNVNYECADRNNLPEKSIYVIRKDGVEWKILQAAPFWPYDVD